MGCQCHLSEREKNANVEVDNFSQQFNGEQWRSIWLAASGTAACLAKTRWLSPKMMMSACCDVSKVRIFVSTPLPSPAGLAETKIQHRAYSKPIRMRQAYVVVTDWP